MELFPEDTDDFRFNSISIKDHVSFANHSDDIALLSSTGEITTTPPANYGLANNFKFSSSPDDSFKKSIKRDERLFTTFKEENIETLGAGTYSLLLEHRKQ